jgi:hypothetical protein
MSPPHQWETHMCFATLESGAKVKIWYAVGLPKLFPEEWQMHLHREPLPLKGPQGPAPLTSPQTPPSICLPPLHEKMKNKKQRGLSDALSLSVAFGS